VALIVPSLLLTGPTSSVTLTPQLIAGGLAAVVAWLTRRVWVTVLVGMIALWLLQWVW
jgi:branched-subunit amino acid transport protein